MFRSFNTKKFLIKLKFDIVFYSICCAFLTCLTYLICPNKKMECEIARF